MLWLWMLWPRTLECLETWMFWLWTLGFLDKYLLGHLSTLFLNVLTIGGVFSYLSIRGSFCAFFARLCHASVKVYVQMNYLFSRNSPSKEAAVLKKYPDKCPKKVLITKETPLRTRLVRKCRCFKEICPTKVASPKKNIREKHILRK